MRRIRPSVHSRTSGQPEAQSARRTADGAGSPPWRSRPKKPVRLFTRFDYQADSWSRPRQIIYKAEITQGKANPRFVVTNIRNRTPRFLYEKVYCARGRSEGFIKNHKTFLNSDRTSCHRFSANQFRLFLHSAAYVLVHAIKHIGMRGTQWTTSNFDTIQLRVLKIGARVREQTTTVRFHFPTSYPLKDLMRFDRLQPRHRVMRTMTTHQKIDHQHDQGISLSGGNATPPDTSTYDQETRTRESHLSEKRLSASSFTESRSN